MTFLELLVHTGLHITIQKTIHFIKKNRKTEFLTYDVSSLLNWYRDETPLLNELPYTELASFLNNRSWKMLISSADIKVIKMSEPFRLASTPPADLTRLQTYVYDAFANERRVDRLDSKVVRLEGYSPQGRRLTIRRCNYSDGLRSNYAMDWHGNLKVGGQPYSLRSLMAQDYGSKLPPLNESRLSNALGLAVIVFYKTDDDDILPYLPKRAEASLLDIALEKVGGAVKRSAVFHGGYHCTASGEAEWREDAETFDDMFTVDICKELFEEVGLSRDDLHWIVPVALCREFLRGGKPQLFYVALAKVHESELAQRRREAIERQIQRNRQEVFDDFLIVESPEQLYRDLAKYGTLEGLTNMIYAQKCAEVAVTAGAFGSRYNSTTTVVRNSRRGRSRTSR